MKRRRRRRSGCGQFDQFRSEIRVELAFGAALFDRIFGAARQCARNRVRVRYGRAEVSAVGGGGTGSKVGIRVRRVQTARRRRKVHVMSSTRSSVIHLILVILLRAATIKRRLRHRVCGHECKQFADGHGRAGTRRARARSIWPGGDAAGRVRHGTDLARRRQRHVDLRDGRAAARLVLLRTVSR
jgi:hypothetical protein